MSDATSPTPANALPLVVQVGFAGARDLFDEKLHPGIDSARFEAEVQTQFETILTAELLPLASAPQLFLCGISPIAVGGDMIFTKACDHLKLVHRVFLPQPREEFLNAVGSQGPDFTPEQKATALQLLASPHVIQERVVTVDADRRVRFQDVSLEMVRVSDVLVCLVREEQSGKVGGTLEFLKLAKKRNRPVLEIRIAVKGGVPVLTHIWHDKDEFQPPSLPAEIASATLQDGAVRDPLPKIEDYTRGLKNLASGNANWGRKHFTIAAFLIIGAHVFATIFAVVALKMSGDAIVTLLGMELVLLAIGFGVHLYLHLTHRVQRWAMSRLAAEVARSVGSVGKFHTYLEYLFTLPFPSTLRPLLRSINVLHLRSTRQFATEHWGGTGDQKGEGEKKRDTYVHDRLVSEEKKAQIPYNKDTMTNAKKRFEIARWTFICASTMAMVATLLKLLTVCDCFTMSNDTHDQFKVVMGFLAIVLPVIAVAALSLASAFDLEARYTNSKELLEFLIEQKSLLENASSASEYNRLLIETETRLLGETVNWYARRSFLGV